MEKDKLSLRRVRINRYGYDNHGCYWGCAEGLYNYNSDSGHIDGYIRANSRHEAKNRIRGMFLSFDIRFYR